MGQLKDKIDNWMRGVSQSATDKLDSFGISLGQTSDGKNGLMDFWDKLINGQTNEANIQQTTETNQTNKEIQDSINASNEALTRETNSQNLQIAQETNNLNRDIANENLQFQKDKLDYDKALQQQIFDREDTSYQRTVDDMRKAGLSPLTMNSTNGSGSVVTTTAPYNDMKYENPYEMKAPTTEAVKMEKANLQFSGALQALNMLQNLTQGGVRIAQDLENLDFSKKSHPLEIEAKQLFNKDTGYNFDIKKANNELCDRAMRTFGLNPGAPDWLNQTAFSNGFNINDWERIGTNINNNVSHTNTEEFKNFVKNKTEFDRNWNYATEAIDLGLDGISTFIDGITLLKPKFKKYHYGK